MTIKEMEACTGLPRANIRYYESQGLLSPARGENGYRDYSRADGETLLKIKLLRQLGFSLEEVQALQHGDRELSAALEVRLAGLTGEREELERKTRTCREMREDGARYDTLDASHYLERLARPADSPFWADGPAPEVLPEDRVPRRRAPFRRFLARQLDGTLYATLVMLVFQIVFRVNIARTGAGTDILRMALYVPLMLLAEAVLLHRFGTTPGKALFGLRVVRDDGSPLSWGQAFRRCGILACILLPVEVLMVLLPIPTGLIWGGYLIWCAWKDKVMPWQGEEELYLEGSTRDTPYWDRASSRFKLLGVLACLALCVGLGVLGDLLASAPRYRGPGLTQAQFVSNYNQVMRYASGGNAARVLEEDGSLVRPEEPPGHFTLYLDDFPAPEFSFTREGERLTSVTLTRSFQDSGAQDAFPVTIPQDEMAITVLALLWDRLGPWEARRLAGQLQERTGDFLYEVPGARIDCTMDFQGYAPMSDGVLLALEDEPRSYDFRFTVALTDE